MKPKHLLHLLPPYSPSAVSAAVTSCAAVGATTHGSAIHSLVKKSPALSSDPFIAAALVRLYSDAGRPSDSVKVFDDFSEPDAVLWTSVISSHARNRNPNQALALFSKMTSSHQPSPVTLIVVLTACTALLDLTSGASVHSIAVRRGLAGSLPLANAVLNMYGKTGAVRSAHHLFQTMHAPDVVSWTTMISCYALNGSTLEALSLFFHMVRHGPELNVVTVVSALHACAVRRDAIAGRRVHRVAAQKGLGSAPLVSTSLIDMYTRCGSVREAAAVFERAPQKDVTMWAAFLGGNGAAGRGMAVFRQMLRQGAAAAARPDSVVVAKAVAACAEAGVLRQVGCLHGLVVSGGFDRNEFVSAALVDAYSKCGHLADAVRVFGGGAGPRDVVVWGSMVAAYGAHGLGAEALRTYRRMTARPNEVVFLSVLAACSRAGMVREGLGVFGEMVGVHRLRPGPEHYSVVVDMLGRMGDLDAARSVAEGVVGPARADVLGALLGACRIHRDVRMGERAAGRLLEAGPAHAGYHLLLSGVYAAGGRWDRAAEVREQVKLTGLKKMVGESLVQVGGGTHGFVADDRRHPEIGRVGRMLRSLDDAIRRSGPHCSEECCFVP